jgi:hypothetical protein
MKSNVSPLQSARTSYQPRLPKVLMGNVSKVGLKLGKATQSIADQKEIHQLFSKTYGQPEVSFQTGKSPASFKTPLRWLWSCPAGRPRAVIMWWRVFLTD